MRELNWAEAFAIIGVAWSIALPLCFYFFERIEKASRQRGKT